MFKILWKLQKVLDLGGFKILNMKWVISRQVSDSPPPQQGASEPIFSRHFSLKSPKISVQVLEKSLNFLQIWM